MFLGERKRVQRGQPGRAPLKKSKFPVWTASTYAPSGLGGRGRFMPRSFSRCSALAFVVFVDITGSPWISLEAASGDGQETPASFVAKPALHLRLHHHRPRCAPPSTCSTSPVTWLASVR